MFFPVGYATGRALDQIAQAKAICRRCQVSEQCLHWVLETNQDAGVWAGYPRTSDASYADDGLGKRPDEAGQPSREGQRSQEER